MSITNINLEYPEIDELLLKCLKRDFPDKLPRKELTPYELGRLVGQQDVIERLQIESEVQ